MSIDRSLRIASSLERHRNVLTRTERIQTLMESEWDSSKGALGLPKIANRKAKAGKKAGAGEADAEKTVEETETTEEN